jgi:hypothetical protein
MAPSISLADCSSAPAHGSTALEALAFSVAPDLGATSTVEDASSETVAVSAAEKTSAMVDATSEVAHVGQSATDSAAAQLDEHRRAVGPAVETASTVAGCPTAVAVPTAADAGKLPSK